MSVTKSTTTARQLVENAQKQIRTLDMDQALALHRRQDVRFVDIRDIRELDKEGKIPGAVHAPRGMLEFWIDPASPYHRPVFASGKTFVFFCAVGWRSALATKTVQDMGLEPVCHVEGGFAAWKKSGGPVDPPVSDRKPDAKIKDNRIPDATETLARLGHSGHLGRQIAFILEIDKLKQVWRQTPLIDCSRKENDAEHSWQLAMMALVLSEYAPRGVDMLKVLKMVLIHDIVEIDAGDSPAYGGVTKTDQYARENIAAQRLFGILPEAEGGELGALWEEFEERKSANALFARAMDRIQPFLHNYFTEGKMWIEHSIRASQVRQRMAIVKEASPVLHKLISDLIAEALALGYLRD